MRFNPHRSSLSLSLSLSLCLPFALFAFFLSAFFYLFVSSSSQSSLLTNAKANVLHLVRARYAHRNANTRNYYGERSLFSDKIFYSIRVKGRKARHFKLEPAPIRALLLLDLTRKREGQWCSRGAPDNIVSCISQKCPMSSSHGRSPSRSAEDNCSFGFLKQGKERRVATLGPHSIVPRCRYPFDFFFPSSTRSLCFSPRYSSNDHSLSFQVFVLQAITHLKFRIIRWQLDGEQSDSSLSVLRGGA